jgi:hypothetical protein
MAQTCLPASFASLTRQRQSSCDLDMTRERRGRPYRLLCTKNQASYERRVTQRKRDLADLEPLNA